MTAPPPTDATYRLVVPEAWTRLPVEPAAMREAARAYLLRRFAHLPRDHTARWRRELEEELVAVTRRPGAEYARMLLVLAADAERRPISASCLVSVLPHALPDEGALQELAAGSAGGAVESVVTELGRSRGVVVVRDSTAPAPADPEQSARVGGQLLAALGAPAAGSAGSGEPWTPGSVRNVDVFLPVPDSAHTLLLAFSTSLVPLFPALTELFVLMAASVQWADGSGGYR